MIYIIFGNQDLMIKRRLNRIIKERIETVDPFNCVQYDLNITPIQEMMDDAIMIPIGVERKVVVGYNATFLSGEKQKGKVLEHNYDSVLEFIAHPSEMSDVIFTCNGTKLDKKNKIVDALIKNAQVYELVNPTKEEWIQFIDATVTKLEGTISFDAKTELYSRTGDNAYLLNNEIEKLLLYDKNITLENVKMLTNLPLEENVFLMFDHLLNKQRKNAIKIYRDLLVKNEEPVRLISILSGQIRVMTDVLALMKENYTKGEIADTLKIHEYRVQLAMQNARKITLKVLMNELDNLYKLDLAIKESKVDRFYGFEMFLLKFNA